MNQTAHTLLNGFGGMTASLLAIISTFQEQLEWWMRMSASGVGILIGIVTLCNLIQNKKRP